jgi:hypothetical protein
MLGKTLVPTEVVLELELANQSGMLRGVSCMQTWYIYIRLRTSKNDRVNLLTRITSILLTTFQSTLNRKKDSIEMSLPKAAAPNNLPSTFHHAGWTIKYNLISPPTLQPTDPSPKSLKTLVFIHGTPWSSLVFQPLVQSLLSSPSSPFSKTHRILLYDMPGSPTPTHPLTTKTSKTTKTTPPSQPKPKPCRPSSHTSRLISQQS